jgi:hypothetical protein
MSHSDSDSTRLAPALLIGLLALVLSGGCWTPKMVHPYIYESGRVLQAQRVELAGQFFPAGSVAAGLGQGFAVRASYGYVGDDVVGWGGELTRSLYSRAPYYVSATAGGEWFESDDHDFSGRRWFGGLTGSWYPGSKCFGVHLPLRVYSMSYNWGTHFIEWGGTRLEPEVGDGVVFVPGIAVSFEGDHVAFRMGASGATVDYLDGIDLWPYVGAQVAIRLGPHPNKPAAPSEF